MGRRLALLVLVVGIAAGGYFLWSWWQGPPEVEPDGPIEGYISPPTSCPVTGIELLQREFAGAFALAPLQGFPVALPWQPLEHMAANHNSLVQDLVEKNPLRFLELCVQKYDHDVQPYSCFFVKKERIEGKLYPPGKSDYEIIKVACREQPFSVFFDWQKHRKLAAKALYVQGENNEKILARGAGVLAALGIQQRALNDADAKRSGRYPMSEFGMGFGIKRTVRAMQAAKARETLSLRYEGQVVLKEIGDRPCYKFIRYPYDPPEDHDGVNELTIYIDCETWLQVGSILRDSDGHLLAEYFFREIEKNPSFDEKQFTKGAL